MVEFMLWRTLLTVLLILEAFPIKNSHYATNLCLTNETRHMINESTLAKMKPTAVLVNVARGDIVDQRALVAALKNGTIFAAGLDVVSPEPLPADDELLRLPNAVVIPHLGSATVQTRNNMAEIAALNVLAGIAGTPMFSPYPY